MEEIIYFELNDWWGGRDYPDEEPFKSMVCLKRKDKKYIEPLLSNDEWCKQNELCVGASFVDMSLNYVISAKKSWVEKNCPRLLTNFTQFLRKPEEGEDLEYPAYGRFGHSFLKYCKENFGVQNVSDYGYDPDEDNEEDDEDD